MKNAEAMTDSSPEIAEMVRNGCKICSSSNRGREKDFEAVKQFLKPKAKPKKRK